MAAGSWSYTWVVPARSLGAQGACSAHPTVSPPCPHPGQRQDTMASRAGRGPTAQPAPNPLGTHPITSIPSCQAAPSLLSLFLWLHLPHSPAEWVMGSDSLQCPVPSSELQGLTSGWSWSQPCALTKALLPWPLPLHHPPRGFS